MKRNFKLSKLIRHAGSILLIFLGIILIFLNILKYNKDFKKYSKQIISQVINSKKELIKNNILLIVSMIKSYKKSVEEKAYIDAKKKVYVAYKIAKNLYEKNKNKLSIKEIEKIIVESLRNLKMEKDDYIFIVKLNGNVLLNAANPYFEGKNFFKLKDNQGRLILKEMANLVKTKGEGFYKYSWHKPGEPEKFYEKISFVKLFKPLNFFIGEGVYPNEIENQIKRELLHKIADIRFGKEGYIFVNKFDGTALVSNGKVLRKKFKLWEEFGKDINRIERVKQIFLMELNAAKKPNGDFIYYEWQKLTNPEKVSKKMSFIYGIKDWQWIIGAGIYLDDLEKTISFLKKRINNECYKSIFFIVFLIFLTIIIFIFLTNKFSFFLEKELSNFNTLFKDSISNKKEIDINLIKIEEIKNFAIYFNEILKENFKIINQLSKSEEKFRRIFEFSAIPMLLLDKNKFIDCNQAALNMLKADKKEDLFVHPADLSPEYQPDGSNSYEKAQKIIEDLYKTGKPISFKWIHKRLNGEIFSSLINLCLIPYNNKQVIFVTWMDISELEKLNEEVQKEKEKLEITLKSVGDGVISTDILGRVELMNEVAEKLTGWRLEEAKGKKLSEVFNIVNYFTREKVENPVDKVLKTGKIVGLANHTILISKDGTEYHIADTAAPIKTKDNKVIGVVLVFRDVTEKVKQEQEIIKIEKLESIGILAGGIAHDFKNILTGITGNISLIKYQLLHKTFEIKKLLERIDKIEHSLERAINLSNQLLTFAKGGELILESIELNDLIKKTVDFHLSGSKIKPIYNFKDKIWKIKGDKSQLSHVFANLTLNAKEAIENSGEIQISIDLVDFAMINNKIEKGKFLKIEFKDSGCGIDKKIINKIFDPFFTTKKDGSGLGLAIVHSIIEKHDGGVTVESEHNKGTVFTIYLPYSTETTQTKTIVSNQNNFDVSKYIKNVLVIDDNEMILETSKEIFNFLGINCKTAKDGESGLKLFKKFNFDVVITDLTIPGGMGGIEIIDEILKINSDAIVIVSSGYSKDPVISDYKKYGFKGRLVKPFTLESIIAELKRIMS